MKNNHEKMGRSREKKRLNWQKQEDTGKKRNEGEKLEEKGRNKKKLEEIEQHLIFLKKEKTD